MSVFSKHFTELTTNLVCDYFSHPGESCLQCAWKHTKSVTLTNFQLFLPIAFWPIAMKWEQRDASLLGRAFTEYLLLTLNGVYISNMVSGGACIFSNLFGKLHYYFVILVPTFFATLLMFVMPPHIQMGHAIAIFNSAFETFVKRQQNSLVTYARTSKSVATFTFMLMSAAILKYLRKNSSMFWFVQPAKKNHNVDMVRPVGGSTFGEQLKQDLGANCYHKADCKQYLLDGMKTNLKIGLLIEVLQAAIKNFSTIKSNPTKLLSTVWNNVNFRMTKFLVAYVGIYRLTHCLLNRCSAINFETSNVLAGFAGGLSYWFLPIYNFYALAFSTLAQLIFHDHSTNSPKFEEFFKNIPLAPIIYMFSLPYIFHHRVFDPSNVSRFCMKVMDVGSNMKSYNLGQKLFSLAYFGHT